MKIPHRKKRKHEEEFRVENDFRNNKKRFSISHVINYFHSTEQLNRCTIEKWRMKICENSSNPGWMPFLLVQSPSTAILIILCVREKAKKKSGRKKNFFFLFSATRNKCFHKILGERKNAKAA